MDTKVPEKTLLRRFDDGSIVLVSEELPNLMQNWRARIRALGNTKECHEWAQRMESVLQMTHRLAQQEVLRSSTSVFRISKIPIADREAIFNAIACIVEAVLASRVIFPPAFLNPGAGLSWSFMSDLSGEEQKRMITAGWCIFTLKGFKSAACVQIYASTQHPYIRRSARDHDNCTTGACIVHHADINDYVAKHAEEGCSCAKSKPLLGEVLGHLGNQRIPVIQLPEGADNSDDILKLGVQDSSQSPYIAISHVWSDGLGSTTEVGLPSCQINHLTRLVSQMLPGGRFWIDSLCVPGQTDMRKRAIGLMADTYRQAKAVLVIDAGIRSCSTHAPLEEKLLRVVSSGWMQRLWTLQEGLLAKEVVFEFKDGLTTLESLIPAGEDLFDPLLMGLAMEVFRLKKLSAGKNFTIGDVSNALRWRTTSKGEDETLAISGLLNVDAFKLVNLPSHAERMKSFLLSVRNLPPNIIFLLSHKLKEDGFRWAPQTLMTRHGLSLVHPSYEAICTLEGLLAEYAAIYFKQAYTFNGNEKWMIRVGNSNNEYFVAEVECQQNEIGVPYTCNAVLFTKLPAQGGSGSCLAVFMEVYQATATDNRFRCHTRRRMVITKLTELESQRLEGSGKKWTVILAAGAGRMKALMV